MNSTDMLFGTENYGDQNSDASAWAILFDVANVVKFKLVSGDSKYEKLYDKEQIVGSFLFEPLVSNPTLLTQRNGLKVYALNTADRSKVLGGTKVFIEVEEQNLDIEEKGQVFPTYFSKDTTKIGCDGSCQILQLNGSPPTEYQSKVLQLEGELLKVQLHNQYYITNQGFTV